MQVVALHAEVVGAFVGLLEHHFPFELVTELGVGNAPADRAKLAAFRDKRGAH